MANISLFERLKTIIQLITSQSFFVTLFIILLLTIIVLIANIKIKSKAPKYAIAIAYTGLAILVLARYGHYVTSLNDSIVDKFFRAMYFPNIVVYLSMLIITVLFLIITIINEKYLPFTKICNFMCFFVIWFLFVLTVDSVKKEGLNFYEVSQIYANSTIMIILQASMCVFGVWCGILISDVIIRKLSQKIDNKTQAVPQQSETDKQDSKKETSIFDSIKSKLKKGTDEEINDYTDEEFNASYTNISQMNEYSDSVTNNVNVSNQNDTEFTGKL